MKSAQSNKQWMGGLAAVGAYALWGFYPSIGKLINGATVEEVLAHRIISFVFMLFLLFTRKISLLKSDMRELIAAPKRLMILTGATLAITVNWYVFIWAVSHGHVVQASLG
jgi:chloramphenicol-sensitive protein RarD